MIDFPEGAGRTALGLSKIIRQLLYNTPTPHKAITKKDGGQMPFPQMQFFHHHLK